MNAYNHEHEKHKILLVTLYAPVGNYGNALQRYALQEIFRSYGFDVHNILCPLVELNIFQTLSRKAALISKRIIKTILAVTGSEKYRKKFTRRININTKDPVRRKLFMEFHGQFITGKIYSEYKKVLADSQSRWQEYEYISSGSDQVWNKKLIFTNDALRFFYLKFAPRDKRINYAPSFGEEEIKPAEISIHKDGLMGFNMLSCREEAGCRIIRDFTGREAHLVLDPTLLLSADDWRKISRKPSYDVPEHYALIYLFGDNKSDIENAKEIAGNMPVIEIYNPNNEMYYLTGPREFIWLFDHADYVLTNSFHGTAFSVIFMKKFVSFRRTDKGFTRIESLLSHLGLTSEIYDPENKTHGHEINYDDVYAKLNTMRESSMKYLRSCLKIHE